MVWVVKYIIILIKLLSKKYIDNLVGGCFHVSFS